MTSLGGLVSTLYLKDPVELVRNQVRVKQLDVFVATPHCSDVNTYPMNAVVGKTRAKRQRFSSNNAKIDVFGVL